MTNPFTKIRTFWGELVSELKKVSWPTWKELKQSTIVVIVGIALMGAYIGIVDFSVYQVVSLFTKWVSG